MTNKISVSQGEGGTPLAQPDPPRPSLTGTESQVEWAERIRVHVKDEFDRVEKSFRLVADRQEGDSRMHTESILAILHDKREEAMSRSDAGYFIREWQEISDQVRQAIGDDPRFRALRTEKADAIGK